MTTPRMQKEKGHVARFSSDMAGHGGDMAARRQSGWDYDFQSGILCPDQLSVKNKGRVMILRTHWSIGSFFLFFIKWRVFNLGHR